MTLRNRQLFFIMGLLLVAASPAFSKDNEQELREQIAALPAEGKDNLRAILYSDLGNSLYRQGRMPEAAQAFEQSLLAAPGYKLRRHNYLYLGKSYESSGRPDKAIPAYEQAVA